MGCICSHELHNVDAAPVDIRARYSIDSLRHNPDHLNDVYLGHGRSQRSHLAAHTATAGQRPLPHSGSGSLSRSQWKQMRALARSNTNPHYHQMQQLQLVQSRALDQQQQPDQLHSVLAAAAAAAGHPASQHQHHHQHHQHHVHLPVVHAGPNPSSQGFVSSTTGHTAGSAPGLVSKPPAEKHALKPTEVLALCGAVVEEDPALAAAGIQPLLLAALCLIESGGRPHAKQYRDHVGDVALGLCQMLLSTATWLASTKGFDRYGTHPSASDLEAPKVCLYYCAAYLSILAQHDGARRSEGFIVKAYHAGPKGVDSQAAGLYWQKYLKAKHCLREVAQAMAVTLAAAAAAAGLPLSLPAGDGTTADAAAAAARVVAGHAAGSIASSTGTEQQQQQGCGDSITPGARGNSSSSPSIGGKDASRGSSASAHDVWVWAKAAQLISSLASRWERDDALAGSAHTGTGAGTGSFMSSILPIGSLWHHSGPGRAQQQQQQQQQEAQSQQQMQQQTQQQQHDAGSGGTLLRRWRSGGGGAAAATAISKSHTHTSSSTGTGTGGALDLVLVSRAAFDAALLRLCCIDHSITCTALSNAACSAAVAAAAAAAASGAYSRGHTGYRSNSSGGAAGAVFTAAAAAAAGPTAAAKAGRRARCSSASSSSSGTDAHADMPCVMHVVGHGETLAQIAAICGVAVPDILAANPDLLEGTNLQANDCIALPVPVVPPRLHVIQTGDTIHSIAKAHRVPLGRLIAKNPELTDPAMVQPGWVVALPGLKGDSKSGLCLDWLAAAAAAAATAPQIHEPAGEGVGKGGGAEQAGITNANVLSWQQHGSERQHQRFRGDQGSGAGQGFKTVGFKVPDDQAAAAGSPPIGVPWPHAGWSSDVTAAAPAVGSGVFMFAVGQGSSSGGRWSTQAAVQQRGKHSSSVSSSGARGTRRGWAVGAAAH